MSDPLYVVVKPFEAYGQALKQGSLVKAETWPKLPKLLELKYLRPATEADAARVEA